MDGMQAQGKRMDAWKRRLATGCAWALIAAPSLVFAQDVAAKDPGIVVLRTVNPRTAYREVPREQMPIHTEVATFPLKVFNTHMDVLAGGELGDAQLLGERGAQGVAGRVIDATSTFGTLLAPGQGNAGGGMSGTASVPLGMGASVGGAVGGATSGLAGTIGSALERGMGVIGAATGGGGGP